MKLLTKTAFEAQPPVIKQHLKPREIITDLIDFLILNLFRPDLEVVFSLDFQKIEQIGVWDEPINWGNLRCVRVEQRKDMYLAFIEEAGDCPNFCKYLEDWLWQWGWNVEIKTEW